MKLPDILGKKRVILCMPVYNEKDVIEEVVKKNFSYIHKFQNSELLVTEDGSSDGTKEVLKNLQKKLKFILYSSNERKGARWAQNEALGNALKAGADIVLITDSDNQHDPNDFDRLLVMIDQADMIVGKKKPRHDPIWRQAGSKLWNLYTRVFFGVHLSDVNSGFRVIKKELLEQILPQSIILQECALSELSIRAQHEGFRQIEVPVTHFNRSGKARAWNPKRIPYIAWNLFLKSIELKKLLHQGKAVRDVGLMNKTYGSYYQDEFSFRDHWFGPINRKYIIPKYHKYLHEFVSPRKKNVILLEIGAGDGEITDYIRDHEKFWHIVPTEVVKEGVEKLKMKGYKDASVASALDIPYPDKSFDYVICFDVMHHVPGPAKMAAEMVRVARKGVFLIEANRQAVARRVLEKTTKYKKAGEFSYYPKEYKAFFNLPDVIKVNIIPFQFIPPKLSSISLPMAITLSEIMGRIPVLRWQCSGLVIEVTK